MNEIPINFILGFARSGTTLTMGLCRTHPEIETDVQEPNHVYRLINSVFISYSGYEKEMGLSTGEVDKMYYNSVRDFTQAYYQRLCRKTNKHVVVIKHPWLTRWIDRLGSTFTGCKMLVMLRHPYDVVASAMHMSEINKSAKKMFGGENNVDRICEQYSEHMGAVLVHAPKYESAGRCKLIKYEELLKNPFPVIRNIFEFYNVSGSTEIVDAVFDKAQKNKASLKGVCLNRTDFYKQKDKWATRLDEHQRQRIRALLSPLVYYLGYEEK